MVFAMSVACLLQYFLTIKMTTLHLAAESGHIKMVDCLLDQGVDINIQDDNSVSLLADYFELDGRCCIHCSFSLLFEIRVSTFKLES